MKGASEFGSCTRKRISVVLACAAPGIK
jgi:hypothetical protein